MNCGAIVAGRFCQDCGQENIDTRETFWSLSKHFIFDILHFDGKFFYTTRDLFARPGYVARRYAEGKRASYLHPIRMYLFMSALFFLTLFSLETSPAVKQEVRPTDPQQRIKVANNLRHQLAANPGDTALLGRIERLSDTTKPAQPLDLDPYNGATIYRLDKTDGRNVAEYDSIQRSLPPGKRDNWVQRKLTIRALEIDKKYEGRKNEAGQAILEKFLHRMPYLFFFSLPFFALLLKLLYARRKDFYYSDHATFTLYHYILAFQLLLLAVIFGELSSLSGWHWLSYFTTAIFLTGMVYLFIEMKNFYRQGFGKTLVKYILLNLLGAIVVFVLFLIFMFFSIFQI